MQRAAIVSSLAGRLSDTNGKFWKRAD